MSRGLGIQAAVSAATEHVRRTRSGTEFSPFVLPSSVVQFDCSWRELQAAGGEYTAERDVVSEGEFSPPLSPLSSVPSSPASMPSVPSLRTTASQDIAPQPLPPPLSLSLCHEPLEPHLSPNALASDLVMDWEHPSFLNGCAPLSTGVTGSTKRLDRLGWKHLKGRCKRALKKALVPLSDYAVRASLSKRYRIPKALKMSSAAATVLCSNGGQWTSK
ncbi:hypothetical protein CERSUDRAFT_95529 [Gelatoporia subvermispora B]|uniref:Uncharacterized protein n=1 Tax=Ceriporiopsis subvermispora (strain B) TaxID=914234 RepID=M2QGJ9_CERS8|nr:hypothetical protein CERSUDRAFT_95529 [Gelatoporia subvermispora B]